MAGHRNGACDILDINYFKNKNNTVVMLEILLVLVVSCSWFNTFFVAKCLRETPSEFAGAATETIRALI